MAGYDHKEKLSKTLSRFRQQIKELDGPSTDLKKKELDEAIREAELVLKEIQADLSQLFLLDNLTIFQATQILAWSSEIDHYHVNEKFQDIKKFHAIYNILSEYLATEISIFKTVAMAVMDGELECQNQRIPNDGTLIDTKNAMITKTVLRTWLLTRKGQFSSVFLPEFQVKRVEEGEPIRQRMISGQEVDGHSHEKLTPQQDDLSGASKINNKKYKGQKEIEAAFAAHGRKVSMRQIRNYYPKGLEVIYEEKGGKMMPTLTDLAIQKFLFQYELKKNA